MANKYFDDHSVLCEQHAGLVDLLGEKDDVTSALTEEPATFCVRCRSMSSSSSILPYEEGDAGTREWLNSLQDSNKNSSLANGYHAPSCGDGADLPLLPPAEGTAIPINGCWGHDCSEPPSTHCHPPSAAAGGSPQSRAARNQLLAATVLCLIFMIAEAVGGYVAGSLAVLTDAAHLLSDLAGFGGALLALALGRRPPSRRLSFGWARAEPLAALASVGLLWAVTAGVAGLAVRRLLVGDFDIDADAMMLVASLGVIINIIMGLVLHGGCGGKKLHHGHSHGPAPAAAAAPLPAASRNINIRAAVVHVVGDLVQSIGVFVAAVLIKFCPGARWADPACTLLCCVLVLCTSVGVAKDASLVLLEACPASPALQPASLASRLHALQGVRAVHDVHVWTLTPGRAALTAHILIEAADENELILRNALKLLRSVPELEHITLQLSADPAS